ncbi:MAG: class IV adenylate cyclase [Acidobacteria bacterium]|nr:class IV adenylate cyclase [Acidobacteriota bacterium]
MTIETEIKLKIDDVLMLPAILTRNGFKKVKDRYFEDNVLFDFPANALRERGCALRVRTVDHQATLTFKGPARVDTRFKSREEIETFVAEGEALKGILSGLGLVPVFRYQKYRTEYLRSPMPKDEWINGELLATIDETPIGAYLELEGEESVITPILTRMGYRESDLIRSTYITIYKCHCEVEGLHFGDMVFD